MKTVTNIKYEFLAPSGKTVTIYEYDKDIAEWLDSCIKAKELLHEVMASPEYLTDNYYRELGKEFRQRYESLCKS